MYDVGAKLPDGGATGARPLSSGCFAHSRAGSKDDPEEGGGVWPAGTGRLLKAMSRASGD